MQAQRAVDHIRERLAGITDLYNRLVLVVGPAASGKTAALRAFAAQGKHPLLNVGMELSRRLLDLTERQRILQLPTLLEDMLAEQRSDLVILDNTEILFSPVLKQDPLRLLLGLSRNRTIITSWLGTTDGPHLTYAAPEHPEFRRYPAADLLLVPAGDRDGSVLAREGGQER